MVKMNDLIILEKFMNILVIIIIKTSWLSNIQNKISMNEKSKTVMTGKQNLRSLLFQILMLYINRTTKVSAYHMTK